MMRRRTGLTAFFALALMIIQVRPLFATDISENTKILLFSGSSETPSVQSVQIVESRVLSLTGNTTLRMKGYIEPVTLQKTIIDTQKELAIRERLYMCREFPCKKTWELTLPGQLSIMDLPNIQLIWSCSPESAAPELMVEAEISPQKPANSSISFFGYFSEPSLFSQNLKPHLSFNMKQAVLKEKTRLYLAKREIGLKTDNNWRYSQDGHNLFLQSRLDLPLKNIHIAQIVYDPKLLLQSLPPEFPLSRHGPLGVQASVDTNGDGRRDLFILSEQIIRKTKRRNGLSILAIDLKNTMKHLGIELQTAVLQELILFMPMSLDNFIQSRPLREIKFYSIPGTNDEMDFPDRNNIIIPRVDKKKDRYYLEFSLLKALKLNSIRDGFLNKLSVTAQFKEPQFIKWDRIRLFSTKEETLSAISEQPGEAFRSWEGSEPPFGPFEGIGSFRPLLWAGRFERDDRTYNNGHTADTDNGDLNSTIVKSKHIAETAYSDGTCQNQIPAWHAPDKVIKEKLWALFSGQTSFPGSITIDRHGEIKKVPLFMAKGSSGYFGIEPLGAFRPGSELTHFNPIGPETINKNKFQLGIFDVKSGPVNTIFNFNSAQWWRMEAELLFKPPDGAVWSDEDDKFYLFPDKQNKKKWTFTLPEATFIAPTDLILPGGLPPNCRGFLQINGQTIAIREGIYKIPLSGFIPPFNDICLQMEQMDDKPLIVIAPPILKVFGFRQTVRHEFKKMLLTIGNKTVPIQFPSPFTPQGGWIDLGSINLNPGEHRIKIKNSPFFTLKRLALEAPAPLKLRTEVQTPYVRSSIGKKLFSLGSKLFLLTAGLFVLYNLWYRINSWLRLAFRPVKVIFLKTYQFIPEWAWILFCVFAIIGFYSLHLLYGGREANYAATTASIFMVVFLWKIGKLFERWGKKRFPKTAAFFAKDHSRLFFMWAGILLFFNAVLFALKLFPLAEQIGIIIFNCLFIGIVIKLGELKTATDDLP